MTASGKQGPETVIAIYRVKQDRLADFMKLLEQHHPTLVRLGLATKEPPIVYSGAERDQKPIVFEIFTWKDGKAPETAHHSPDVMKIWEAMGGMTEERGGIPKFEFPHVERVELAKQRS